MTLRGTIRIASVLSLVFLTASVRPAAAPAAAGWKQVIVRCSPEDLDRVKSSIGAAIVDAIPGHYLLTVRSDVDTTQIESIRGKGPIHASDNQTIKIHPRVGRRKNSGGFGLGAVDYFGTNAPVAYIDQPAASKISLSQAHGLSTGWGSRVAVIDTGIDMDHPVLQGVILAGKNYVGSTNIPSEWDDPVMMPVSKTTIELEQNLHTAMELEQRLRKAIEMAQNLHTAMELEQNLHTAMELEQSLRAVMKLAQNLHTTMELEQNLHTAMELEQKLRKAIELAQNQHTAMELEQNLHTAMELEQNLHTAMELEQNLHTTMELESVAPLFGHGTMTAGLVHLVAPNAGIIPLKAFDASGASTEWNVVRAVLDAVDMGADVINMSFASGQKSKILEAALDYAASKGVALVAAAGNSDTDSPTYPASLDVVVGITALDLADQKAPFANYGKYVDLSAPGVDLITTYPGMYAIASGTSESTPLVSGVFALVKQRGTRGLTPRQTVEAGVDVISVPQQYRNKLGEGRINAYKALK